MIGGWKTKIILLASFVILINFVTKGVLLELLIPRLEENKGDLLCFLGGFMFSPTAGRIGPLWILYPSGDDALFATGMTIVTVAIIRGVLKSKSWKIKILAITVSWLSWWSVFKMIGFVLILFSGKEVATCVEYMSLGGFSIPYSIFDPIFIIGFVIAVVSFVGLIWSFKKEKKV